MPRTRPPYPPEFRREAIRREIEAKVHEMRLAERVPGLSGFLHHSSNPSEERT